MISKDLHAYISQQAPVTDAAGTFPKDVFDKLAEEGLLKIVLPDHVTDFNVGNTPTLLNQLKLLGSADLSAGRIYEGHINALYLIHLFAKASQKEKWYENVLADKMLFGVWNTQDENGIHIHDLGNGRYQLQGCKTFCSGSGYVNRPLVTGELEGSDKKGWQMCIIPVEKIKAIPQDTSFWQPMGMKASVSYKMDFSGIEITEDDLLGEPGDYYQQPAFSGGAIRFAAVQLGGAEALLDATANYLKKLKRTGDAFQKLRLAEMAYLVTSGNQWLETAGNKTDKWLSEKTKTDEIIAYANMTRNAIEEISLRTMKLAERSVGARGLMRPNSFERIHRDLTFYLRQPAPDASLTAIADFIFNQNRTAAELWS